jgi:hypothetical protein
MVAFLFVVEGKHTHKTQRQKNQSFIQTCLCLCLRTTSGHYRRADMDASDPGAGAVVPMAPLLPARGGGAGPLGGAGLAGFTC